MTDTPASPALQPHAPRRRHRRPKDNVRRTTPVDAAVGRRVRDRRVELGMSQTALAEACGITFQQVQKYERGGNRVSASRLWQMAAVLGVPVDWFFGELGDPAAGMPTRAAADDAADGPDADTVRLARRIATLADDQLRKRIRTMLGALAGPVRRRIEARA